MVVHWKRWQREIQQWQVASIVAMMILIVMAMLAEAVVRAFLSPSLPCWGGLEAVAGNTTEKKRWALVT